MATSRNLYPDGPLLKEKALAIGSRLGHAEGSISASYGWLESWEKRHNIKQVVISGESGDGRGETVLSWKERLLEIVAGYHTQKTSVLNQHTKVC